MPEDTKNNEEHTKTNEEVKTESKNEERNLEEEFTKMIKDLEIKNDSVRTKREELGLFEFNVRSSTKGLNFVKDMIGENKEIYYGFMYD